MKAERASTRFKTLSPGCRSCQEGKWICVFLTYRCNAGCAFCPAPWKQQDRVFSALGDTPSAVDRYLDDNQFNGMSFSGGDCFLVFNRLLKWLSYFRKRRPGMYFWAYTSGISADRRKLERLADAGLNEIRYNIAATGYNDPAILAQIREATQIFRRVAVEIPSIPEDRKKLTRVLPVLERVGVRYLNLHEYILVGSELYARRYRARRFVLNKKMQVNFDGDSMKNTRAIQRFCRDAGFAIRVNNCSMKKKERQMVLRRRTMGRLFRTENELLRRDGLLETRLREGFQLSRPQLKAILATAEGFDSLKGRIEHPLAGRGRKLILLPPMGVNDRRALLAMEE